MIAFRTVRGIFCIAMAFAVAPIFSNRADAAAIVSPDVSIAGMKEYHFMAMSRDIGEKKYVGSSAEAPVSEDLHFSLVQCIQIALERNPDLAYARSQVSSQTARMRQAAAPARPHVDVTPSYTYSGNDGGGNYDGNYSDGNNVAADISLQQLIYDWGKTELNIKQSRQERDARISDQIDLMETVVQNVSDAYYTLNKAYVVEQINRERVLNYENRLKWAQNFYRVGTKPKIEVTKAEADLANAKLDDVSAVAAREQAVANLAYAMGVPQIDPRNVDYMLSYADYPMEMQNAITSAMQNRQDLAAQDLRVGASETALQYAKKGLSPTLSGSAGYSLQGDSDPTESQSWRVSIGLDFPVFDGGLTREQINQASADLTGTKAKRESLRQGIVTDVRTAYLTLVQAKAAVSASREAERSAKATLDLATGRYKAGVGEYLEISDAVEGYATAQKNVIDALYNHRTAVLGLKRAMGVLEK